MTKFQLESFHRNVSEDELIEDLKRVHSKLQENGKNLTFRTYHEFGKYSAGTYGARFGSWNNALKKAGLELNEEKDVSKIELFRNLETVWISKGKQPVWRDMSKHPSKYGAGIYQDRFGSWRNALEQFVEYINDDTDDLTESETVETNSENISKPKRRSSRNISERMRFRILIRDGFTCQSCGASPLKMRGIELHVDHIIPWSKGGETEDENLETKCSRCNLGKGNAFTK